MRTVCCFVSCLFLFLGKQRAVQQTAAAVRPEHKQFAFVVFALSSWGRVSCHRMHFAHISHPAVYIYYTILWNKVLY